ncbi:MAG TPA: IS110 family transposase [Candidatus Moranbacteria bacterium]|nr:IS110 family transposase [Candidatus Moranbacteria bacterium]HAT75164.1 IS110 family transposase [Candidatus Moranbacteria bacterium]
MEQKQVIGIDVSSKKLNLHFLGTKFDFEISNTHESVRDFLKQEKLSVENCIFGAESTGRYHLICQEVLVTKGFEFRLINPILTGKKISTSIRKKKTDKNDAKLIARIISQGEGRIVTLSQLDVTRRTLLRTRRGVVNQRTAVKIIFKELKMMNANSQINMAMKSLEKLIKHMDTCVENIEELALDKNDATKDEKLIQSFPGFGARLSAIVSVETRDFSRFPTATQYKAYVGIDPKVMQSGESLRMGRITKRGNAHLRTAFYLAAQVARCHDPELKEFYLKKKAEGKMTRVAIIAVARKLCERVFAVVKRGTPYEVRQIESQVALA